MSDDLHSMTIFAYNPANEQTKRRAFETESAYTDMDITYDDWGRMATRQMAGHTSAFDYRYGDKLKSVASDFPDEPSVTTFNYDGLGKLRFYEDAAGPEWFRWDRGWHIVGTYGADTQDPWAIGAPGARLTHDPSTMGGSPLSISLVLQNGDLLLTVERDRLGSMRRARLSNYPGYENVPLAQREYGPYGETYSDNGADVLYGYTGYLAVNPDSDYPTYYAPYRFYSPDSSRWTTRDPLGMVDGTNVYEYVGDNPILYRDPMGLAAAEECPPGERRDMESKCTKTCENKGGGNIISCKASYKIKKEGGEDVLYRIIKAICKCCDGSQSELKDTRRITDENAL